MGVFWASVAVAEATIVVIVLLLRKKPRIDPFSLLIENCPECGQVFCPCPGREIS